MEAKFKWFLYKKYQNHACCSYRNKLVYVDDKFSKPFKSDLGEDAIYNFINSMIEENKYCSDVKNRIPQISCNFEKR